jgi:hypothetical protein
VTAAEPPGTVTVIPARPASQTRPVTTTAAEPPGGTTPVAVNDEVALNEDTSLDIQVLVNDTWDTKGTVAVNLVGLPRLGTATVVNNVVHYVPFANANGSEGIAYTITDGNGTSPIAYIAIAINPVNDAPVALADAVNAVAGQVSTLNVVANDTDVDGATDIKAVVIVTPPVGATAVVDATGLAVTFTAQTAGSYGFTYQVRDGAGVLSNTVTVSVTVNGAETVTVSRADFIRSKLRWRVDGTAAPIAGQTITVTYANGTLTGGASATSCVLGTALVDAAGAWTLDRPLTTAESTTCLNPQANAFSARPTSVKGTSSLTGAAGTRAIALK